MNSFSYLFFCYVTFVLWWVKVPSSPTPQLSVLLPLGTFFRKLSDTLRGRRRKLTIVYDLSPLLANFITKTRETSFLFHGTNNKSTDNFQWPQEIFDWGTKKFYPIILDFLSLFCRFLFFYRLNIMIFGNDFFFLFFGI